MTKQRLESILDKLPNMRIAVVGDLFLDKWLSIDRSKDEDSIETGLIAYQVVAKRTNPGAAGTVLGNLNALGVGELYALGFLGDDGDGYEVLKALKKMNINTENVVKSTEVVTPAYVKPMFFTLDHQEVEHNRFDTKNTKVTPHHIQLQIGQSIEKIAGEVDAIIVLDQLAEVNRGVITEFVRNKIAEIALKYPELTIFADSRNYIDKFRNVITKCNSSEAGMLLTGEQHTKFSKSEVCEYMRLLSVKTNGKAIITCGEDGVLVEQGGKCFLLPAVKQVDEIDVCGAGDACSSGIVCALCAGASYIEAAEIGNLASGITVRKIGTTGTVSSQEMMDILSEISEVGF